MTTAYELLRKKLTRNDWIVILTNLVPVAGVWFLGWSAIEVFIVYALETLVLGILTVLKLFISTLAIQKDEWHNNGKTQRVSGLFFIVFFILHFGIFAAVQTSIFSGVAGIIPTGKGPLYFFFHWWEYINEDIAWMLGGFVLSYFARDLIPFIVHKRYQDTPMMILMFQPYGRIIIQQFTVILGSMFLTFHLGKVFIIVFALAKILVEVYLNIDWLLGSSLEKLKQRSGEQ